MYIQVALCQFVRLHDRISKRILFDLAQRHCGCAFKEFQQGADLGIPIFAESPSMLLFQIKNLRGNPAVSDSSDQTCRQLLPSRAFATSHVEMSELSTWDKGCVRVYMQLGSAIPFAVCRSVGDSGANPLQLFGLGARCLSEKVRDSLSVLLLGQVDLDSFLDSFDEFYDKPRCDPRPTYLTFLRYAFPFLISLDIDYNLKRKSLLQVLCQQRGLVITGSHAELCQRLMENDKVTLIPFSLQGRI